MKQIRLATNIFSILLKDHTHYRGRLIADTFSLIARCGILLLLYSYVFTLRGGEVNGTPFIIIAWSILIYFVFMVLRLRDITRMIMHDVQSGTIEVLMSKPIPYLMYRMYWQLGSGLYSFLVALVVGVITLTLILGVPETMTSSLFLFTFPIVFVGAILLSLLIYTIIGLFSFWIEDVNPIFWVVDKAVMILGGSYLPVALFPDFLYKLAIYSPFGASQFITHTAYESWTQKWQSLILIQYAWILALTLLTVFLFISARKKVSVNGG